jgi:hypothetical protein
MLIVSAYTNCPTVFFAQKLAGFQVKVKANGRVLAGCRQDVDKHLILTQQVSMR